MSTATNDQPTCPVHIWRGFQSDRCGRPVKRNGKCGVHAAADERHAAKQERWNREYEERQIQRAAERALEDRIAELGGAWPITREQLIEILEARS